MSPNATGSWTISESRELPSTAFAGTGLSTFPWAGASGSQRVPTESWRRLSAGGRSPASAPCGATGFTLSNSMFPTGQKLETYGYQYPIQDCTGTSATPRRRHRLHVRLPVVPRLHSNQPHQQPYLRRQAQRHHGRARPLQTVLRAADSQWLHRAAGQCAGQHGLSVSSGIRIPSGSP